MTASAVTQVNLISANSPKTSSKAAQPVDDFSELLKNQSQKNTEIEKSQKEIVKEKDGSKFETTKKLDNRNVEKTEKKDELESKDVTKSEEVNESEELKKEDVEKVYSAIAEMVNAISSELQVSPDQVGKALTELDMLPEDVLNLDALPKLVAALTGSNDELALLTDEKIFQSMELLKGQAKDILKGLSEQLQLPVEDLKNVLAKATEVVEISETDMVLNVNDGIEEDLTLKNQSLRTAGLETATSEGKVLFATVTAETSEQSGNHDSSKEQGNENAFLNGENNLNFSQKVFDELKAAVVKTESDISYVSNADSIMNQIENGIKIIQKQNLTEMELQLNPASLGHVRVQLSSKEGILTASFTAENEAVRAALESQMTVLKQNFEQQGLKVEAVEVTVASHAFEENLNNSEHSSNSENEQKKNHRRKLSLSEIMNADTMDELPTEERVVADMMMRNGNSVDYQA